MPQLKRTATGVLGGLAGLVGLSAVAGLLVTATVTPAIAVSGYAASSALDTFDKMPSFLDIEDLMLPTEIYRKDEDGKNKLLARFYDQNRIPVEYDDIAPVMLDAILSSEDQHFYEHGGIDLAGTLKALASNATSGSNRGGSSITQQYVKNVLQQNCESKAVGEDAVQKCYEDTSVNEGSAGYQRKLQEMRYAIQLEKRYSKEQILTGYLNIVGFGNVVYGIGAAAKYYFDVPASKLSIAQAATIAGMVQQPSLYRIDLPDGSFQNKAGELVNSKADGYSLTLERRNYVLGRMLKDKKISQAEYDEAKATAIEPKITPRARGCEASSAKGAEFFCAYVVSIIQNDKAFGETEDDRIAKLRRGGMKIYTTLDPTLQKAANKAISIVPKTVPYMDLGASGVQVEVGTGRVLSMVQNRPYSATGKAKGTTPVNYNVRAQNGGGGGHSAGSTYKVFSLINWLEQGHSVNEYVNGRVGDKTVDMCNGQTQLVHANNNGGIGNFERNPGYTGTVYNFTRDSLNSGFLAMAEKISVCTTNETAMKMGVTLGDGGALDKDNFGYNVLGDQAVAPIDMANAYASIAADGTLCQAKAIDKALDADGNDITPKTTCKRVMSEGVAATAAYTLQGVMNGTAQGARIYDGVPVFGKTGIHEYIHTWMDGASTKVATVVWVGNVKGKVKLNEHGASGYVLSRIRNGIWPKMQGAANAKYGGDKFPTPDSNLIKRQLTDLPSVIGMSIDEATSTLRARGFSVTVGDEVPGTESKGTIIEQSPGAGRVAQGATIVIRPSSGDGVAVPGVSGSPRDAAQTLRSAGFDVGASCTQADDAPGEGVVTGTDPSAGKVLQPGATVTVEYRAQNCDGRP